MIDIIIPAYNAHDTIEQTLFSIAVQDNVEDINVYIIDDCSSSNYSDIVSFFSNLFNIKEIRLDKNSGPGVARQVGIDNSKSPYIMFIDADDVFSNCKAVGELYKNIINDYDLVISNFAEEINNKLNTKQRDTVWLHGKMYRRSFLEKHSIKFNDTRSNEDNAFNQLILLCGAKIYYCDFVSYIWKENINSITRKNNREYCFKSISSYIYNISWALEEGNKRGVDVKKLASLSLTALIAVYYYYLIYNDNPVSKDFIKESVILKKYADFSVLSNDDINEIFKVQFDSFSNNINISLLLNPIITFQDFVNKIGGKK